MSDELKGQDLIEAFLAAVHLRHLDRCLALLDSLKILSHQRPTFKPWCLYLQGILTFEVHGDWAEAERIFSKLLQTDLEPTLRGRVLYGLGRSLDVQGRWDEAIATFEQAVEFGQTVEKAKAWKHIAISYRKGFTQGDFGFDALHRAIEYYQLALAALEPISEPSSIAWLKGSVWNALGLAYRDLGRWDEAIACYQQDLSICREQKDRFGMGITYGNLGEVYQKQGNYPEAMTAYHQALSLIREFQGHYEEIDVLANLAFLYQEMGEAEAALDYYGQAIEVIESLRAGASSEMAQAGFFATVVDTYANTVLLCLAVGRYEQAFHLVERARSRAFLDLLLARSPAFSRQVDSAPLTLAEAQAALPPDTLLLEYFTTGLVEAPAGDPTGDQNAQRYRFPPPHTLLFAVTRDALHVHDTGLSPNDLRPRQLRNVVERHFLQHDLRRALFDRLIAPVSELLPGKRRLYLIPHGPLHYIPFQALLAPDGTTLLHDQGPQLVYAPSATVLLRRERVEHGQALASCLAVGYNGQGERRLRFAEEEGRSIAGLTGGRALTGTRPKKDTLYQQAARYRLLHISCHGEFDPDAPLASALHLGPDEDLTALDILEHLHLRPGCELVTLSACESGLSRVRRGDELIGLIRAFMIAGAPVLVASLWRVDERSTRILMEKFYQEIRRGVGYAQALKQAQLYLKNLTYGEALAILSYPTAPADEVVNRPSQANSSKTLPGGPAWFQARAYLKGLAGSEGQDRAEIPMEGTAEARIFADPFHWAPFILVGDYEPEPASA